MMVTLRERLGAGEMLFTAWSGVPDALTVELLAAQSFECVTLDMQHGAHGDDSVAHCVAPVLAAGKHALVRIPVGRFDMASRVLDFGAEAVIAPMINSVQDARRFAVSAKYPPLGERSWGPTFGLPRHGGSAKDWVAQSNGRTVAFAMVETREALAALDEILATPGIDGIFVGPSDFSLAWTNGAQLDPLMDAIRQPLADIARRTRAAGKFAAIYLNDPAIAGRLADEGYQLFAYGSEGQLFATGAAAILDPARASLKRR